MLSAMFWKRRDDRSDAGGEDSGWPFDQGPNVGALTVRSVLAGDSVLFVSHDADDHGWQFLDGREPDTKEGRIVCMADALERDPTLRTIADLSPGWIAWRDRVGDRWTREPNPRLDDDGLVP
jgi:hypothetical protein